MFRFRWSLVFVKKLTMFDVRNTKKKIVADTRAAKEKPLIKNHNRDALARDKNRLPGHPSLTRRTYDLRQSLFDKCLFSDFLFSFNRST